MMNPFNLDPANQALLLIAIICSIIERVATLRDSMTQRRKERLESELQSGRSCEFTQKTRAREPAIDSVPTEPQPVKASLAVRWS